MASAISEIYNALADISIAGVGVRNIDEIKLQVRQVDTPVRMLLPSTSGELSFVAIGSLNKIEWIISDLCLWAPLTAGQGVKDHANDMVEYIKNYLVAIKALRSPTSQSHITGISFEMGPVPWADGDFWAVDVTISVEEII